DPAHAGRRGRGGRGGGCRAGAASSRCRGLVRSQKGDAPCRGAGTIPYPPSTPRPPTARSSDPLLAGRPRSTRPPLSGGGRWLGGGSQSRRTPRRGGEGYRGEPGAHGDPRLVGRRRPHQPPATRVRARRARGAAVGLCRHGPPGSKGGGGGWGAGGGGGVWVKGGDDAAFWDFLLPAVLRRGRLIVAVSTGGASPALAAGLRRDLEAHVPPEYESLVELAAEVRSELRARASRPG